MKRGWSLAQGAYAFRVAFCLVLLGMLGMYHWAFQSDLQQGSTPARTKELLANTTTGFLAVLHVVIALLIAPIAAAGAFNRERVRTMIPALLATPLSARRIALETFAARLIPGLSLWLCLIPITVFMVPWCALDPEFVAIMEGVTLGTILLGVAAALALSLCSGRMFVALFGVYGIWSAWMLIWSMSTRPPLWFSRTNPYLLLVIRSNGKGRVGLADAWFFLSVAGLVSTALVVLTIITFRRVALAPPRRLPPRRTRLSVLGAAWSGLVVRLSWPESGRQSGPLCEWRCAGRSLGGRLFWAVYALVAMAFTAGETHSFWHGQIGRPDLVATAGFEVGIGLLAVAVHAASAWSEEKGAGQGAVDVLLATPMPASTFIKGKWWGAYRAVLLVALLPTVSAIILAAGRLIS